LVTLLSMGKTGKQLPDEEKATVTDEKSATALMIVKNSVIKRPLIEDETGKVVALGFSEDVYETTFL
jgi:arsenate reductase